MKKLHEKTAAVGAPGRVRVMKKEESSPYTATRLKLEARRNVAEPNNRSDPINECSALSVDSGQPFILPRQPACLHGSIILRMYYTAALISI